MSQWIHKLERRLPAAAVAFAAVFSLRQLDDFDTWWHLASGRWIYTNAAVPHHDVLSYTVTDKSWTNLQWLYDLILYGLYSLGGADLLVIGCAVCFTAAAALLARNLAKSLGPAASCALLIWVLAAANERFLIRPEMVSFVLLEALLLLLAGIREDKGRRLWMLVPVMVLWVNTHALFVLGIVVIVAAMSAPAAARLPLFPRRWREASRLDPESERRLWLAGAAACAATLLNPYLLDGVLFPLELFTRIDGSNTVFQTIGEFRPPFSGYFPTFAIGAYQAFLICSSAVVVLAGLVEAFGRRGGHSDRPARFDLGGLAVFVAFAYLSLLARRNAGIFVMAAAPFTAQCLGILGERFRDSIPQTLRRGVAAIACVALPSLLAIMSYAVASNWWYVQRGESHASGLGVFPANFPRSAADFVRDQGLPGPMYNDLTAGGYLTWARPTGMGVYVDGRLEVYDEDFISLYSRSLSDARTFNAEVQRHGIQTVLLFHRWGNRHPLISWLSRNPAWSLAYHDPVAVVFVRNEGNGDAIARARNAFPALLAATQRRLSAPQSSWRIPVSLYTEILSYAQLMETLGDGGEARRLYALALAQGLSGEEENRARLKLAVYLGRAGEMSQARLQVLKVLENDEENDSARRLLEQLERFGG